jgi:polyisoprenyl-phosphate glycosyltransferase
MPVLPVSSRCLSARAPLSDKEGWHVEWIFVDDASPDDSWRILKEQACKDDRIGGLGFGRNCGQHAAIYAGLEKAKGRFSVVMDGDLEDPPEEIPRLMARARQGSDIVIATYSDRTHPAWRRLGSRLYFWMLHGRGAGTRLSTYSVLSERARSAYLAAPLAGRAYLSVLFRLNLPTAFVSSHKEARLAGGSSYSLGKLSPLAVRNILLFNPWRLLWVLMTLAIGVLFVGVGLWGPWPAIPIGLVCLTLVGATLAVARSCILARGWSSPHLCETETL